MRLLQVSLHLPAFISLLIIEQFARLGHLLLLLLRLENLVLLALEEVLLAHAQNLLALALFPLHVGGNFGVCTLDQGLCRLHTVRRRKPYRVELVLRHLYVLSSVWGQSG